MYYVVMAIMLCVAIPSRFEDDRYFKAMATAEYEQRVIDRYVSGVRADLKYKGQCFDHSIELIRRLRNDVEQCSLMGIYRRGARYPHHYYVFTKRWGAVDPYPEGHHGPLNGDLLDDYDFRVPPYAYIPPVSKVKLPVKPVEIKPLA